MNLSGTAFVGRQREMTELSAALDEVTLGRGRLVMLVDEPGIGKTRTSQEFALSAQRRGHSVLRGRGYEGEGAPPFWLWVQILRTLVHKYEPEQLTIQMGPGAADIAELVPELNSKLPDLPPIPAIGPEEARFRLFDSISTFLRNVSELANIRTEYEMLPDKYANLSRLPMQHSPPK